MTLTQVLRVVYVLIGVIYVLIGVGAMVSPTGWFPDGLERAIASPAQTNPFDDHLLQEFGTSVLAVGLVFLWAAGRKELSAAFHWLMTAYFAFHALIHWVGPDGLIGSWSRGITNSVPFAVMLLFGVLQLRVATRRHTSS